MPIFKNDEIVFYQMNGFVFATWLQISLEADSHQYAVQNPGAITLAHNVGSADAVDQILVADEAATSVSSSDEIALLPPLSGG